jgi:hypothetical protein
MNATPTDVIQRTTKPNLGLLAIVETVDDKAVIAYVPLAPERYRIAHDDYAVIGQAAVMNPVAVVATPEKPVVAPKRNGPVPREVDIASVEPSDLPPPIPPPPQGRRQPFGRFIRPGFNPDILPDGDGSPIADERAEQPARAAIEAPPAPPLPQPSVPPPTKPPKKRKILDVEI